MRPIFVAILACAALAPAARAGDLRNFDDAALNAIQFVDRDEGWAVGDEGVVWHTIDAGKTWERQPTGVRASLRSLHFLNPYTGWAVGREELPHGAGSIGVLLFTRDGGLKWQQVHVNALPGLNQVRFTDNRTGFVVGDGTDQYATGVFQTSDSGRSWQPLPGPRCPGWLAASFQDAQLGALAGTWSRMAMVRRGSVAMADLDTLGGRSLRGLQIVGERAVAVGQGGVVLLSDKTSGGTWQLANLRLPAEVLAGWDFHAVHCVGKQMWVVGRPGSVVLHSADLGNSWDIQSTKQPVPLNGVFFSDDLRGWAVGELGSILATTDGGRSWQVQHRGGQQAAVLFIHASATGLPVDTVALLGGEEGYLAAALRVIAADPGSAAMGRAGETQRFAAAVRQTAGAAGETLWQFPAPQHLARADRTELLKNWDERLHAGKAAEQLLRQLVLAVRIWRPEVVITDPPEAQASSSPSESLVAEAVHEAYVRAADPKAFPEQIEQLGLQPWRVGKLYARWESRTGAQVALDLNDPRVRLESTARDFASSAAGLLADAPVALPTQRYYRLLDSRVEGAAAHTDLMQGVTLAPSGVARRRLEPLGETDPEIVKNIRSRRNFQVLAEMPAGGLTDPNKLLSQIGSRLAGLPDDQAAPAAFAAASQYARMGQWTLAREAYLLMVDRYPAHPLAADAYRWLIRHNSSSEARRRQELGQFLALTQVEITGSPKPTDADPSSPTPRTKEEAAAARAKKSGVPDSEVEISHQRALVLLGSMAETRRWYQGSLEIEPRLAAFGSLFATDPSIQFPLQAARRGPGEFDTPKKWYADFMTKHRDGPWREAAAAELWLANRTGPPPKPIATCRQTSSRPFLDGNLDDACWKDLKPITLRNAVGDTVKDYPTQAWLAYDKDFLYLALRCRHPADRYVEPVKRRTRDADLNAYDRVSLLLDLDRDYSTCFHLQIDQRGCLREDCWGDPSWNPRWFVAAKSDTEGWQIEAAIPMVELTGDTVTLGRAWACNVVRILPGRGVQAMSTPADVLPRPEGMGLLIFTQDPAKAEPAARTTQTETGAAGGR